MQANPQEVELYTKAESKFENEEVVQAEDRRTIQIEQMGEKVSVQGENTQEVYKGYIYEAKGNKTDYEENYIIENSNLQNVEEINLTKEKEVFTYDNENSEISTNNSIYYTQTIINKAQMLKILGEEGKITIKNDQEIIIKEITKENEEDENGNIVVNYEQEEAKNIKITTTKPVKLGELKISNKKAIACDIGYAKEEIEKFENLETTIKVNASVSTLKMNLLNTKQEVEINMSQNNLSTMQKNENIQINVILQTKANQNDLYKNPKIDIILPKEIEIDVKKVTQLNYEDIMQVGNVEKLEDEEGRKILRIALNGEQTSYTNNEGIQVAISGDIDVENTTPSKEANIEVVCTNENKAEQFKTQYPLKLNSKYGVLMISKIENYNQEQEIQETIDNEEKTAKLNVQAQGRQASQTIQIINNYENAISKACIIGNVSSQEQSIDLKLEQLEILGNKNAKIYYSSKEQTQKDSIEWKENIEEVEKVKAYKIIIEDDIQSGENVEVKCTLNIPENLEVGKNSNIQNTLTYNYLNNEEKTTSNIKFTTGNNQVKMFSAQKVEEDEQGMKVEISAITGDQILKDEDEVKEGQGIRYNIRVTNNSDSELKNVVLDATNTNAIYYNLIEYEEKIDDLMQDMQKIDEDEKLTSKTLTIASIPVGETKEVSYQICVKQVEDENQTLTGQIKIKADNHEESVIQNITNKIKKGNIKATLRYLYSEDQKTTSWSAIPVQLNIKNISKEVQENLIVEMPIVEELQFPEDDEITNYLIIEDERIKFVDYVNGIAKFEISEINVDETISMKIRFVIEEIDINKSEQLVSEYFKVSKGEEIYISNDIQRNIEQEDTIIVAKQTTNMQKKEVKNGDNIKLFINIENQGTIDKEITISDEIPSGLKINHVKIKTSEEEREIETSDNLIIESTTIKAKEKIEIEIDTTVDEETFYDFEITNYAEINGSNVNIITEEITFTMEKIYEPIEDDDDYNYELDAPVDDYLNDPNNPGEPYNPDELNYSISGLAWIDSNSNGEKESNESKISNMPVYLVNEQTGKSISSKTNEDGSYNFDNVEQGKYIVAFKYDENKYTVTTYQKEGVDKENNSDVIYGKMNIENNEMTVAKTKTLELKSESLQNIDAGFVEGKNFDLKIDKTINKVTVSNNAGTKTNTYSKQKLVKVEIDGKQLASSNVVIEYNIAVTNQGEIGGYASEIVDNIPEGLSFSSELNKSWYKMTNGSIATKELANQLIKPGETKEVTLILTKKMTKDNTGTVTNRATINKYSNDYMVEDKMSDNNESKAEVIISVRTGKIIIYISIIMLSVAIIGTGIYFIKKKVLIERR